MRLRRLTGAGGREAGVATHALPTSFVALVTALAAMRLACATACPRTDPATEFAELSHMLMNGFFFNQGFDIMMLRPSQ